MSTDQKLDISNLVYEDMQKEVNPVCGQALAAADNSEYIACTALLVLLHSWSKQSGMAKS